MTGYYQERYIFPTNIEAGKTAGKVTFPCDFLDRGTRRKRVVSDLISDPWIWLGKARFLTKRNPRGHFTFLGHFCVQKM